MNDPQNMDTSSLLNRGVQPSPLDIVHATDNNYGNNLIDSFLSPPPLMNSKEYENNNSHSTFFPSQQLKYPIMNDQDSIILPTSDYIHMPNDKINSHDIPLMHNSSSEDYNSVTNINLSVTNVNNIDHLPNEEPILDDSLQINHSHQTDVNDIGTQNSIIDESLVEINYQNGSESLETPSTEMDSSLTNSTPNTEDSKNQENDGAPQNGLGIYECMICKNIKSCQYQIPKQPSLDNSIINTDVYICDKQCLTVFINKNLLEVISQETIDNEALQQSTLPQDIEANDTSSHNEDKSYELLLHIKKRCIFCYSIMPDFLSHLFISDDSSKPICPKHLPCQAVQFSLPSCVECGKRLIAGRMILLDSNLDFCSEQCLSIFLPKLSINCYLCSKILTKEAFGQYCLKLENRNIRQFCGEACLENFNPLATYCTFCHKDITSMTNPIAINSDNFCSKSCVHQQEKLLESQKLQRETGQCPCDICSICQTNQPILQNLVAGPMSPTTIKDISYQTTLFKICSQRCLNTFIHHNQSLHPSTTPEKEATNALPTQHTQTLPSSPILPSTTTGGSPTLAPKKSACEMCHVSMLGRKSMSALTVDGRTHFFCSQACTEKFKRAKQPRHLNSSSNASSVVEPSALPINQDDHNNALSKCQWCHGTKYLRDMVAVILDDEDGEPNPKKRPKSSITPPGARRTKDSEVKYFCSQNCVSLYKMNEDSEMDGNLIPCANCHKEEPCQYSLVDGSGDLHKFCTPACVGAYKKQHLKNEPPKRKPGPVGAARKDAGSGHTAQIKSSAIKSDLSGIRETIKKMAAMSKSPDSSFKVLLDILKAATSEDKGVSTGGNGLIWPSAPRDLKNKSTSIKPLVRSQGTSCQPSQTAEKETQTDDEPPRILPIPIPVPFYVPFPLHMYTSYTPVPMALPVPIVVPTFIPTTYSTAEEISKYIKTIKDKVPSDPLQAELLMIAQMVADNDEVNPNTPVPPDPVHLKPLKGTPGFKPLPENLLDNSTAAAMLGHNATSISGPTLTASGDEVYQIQFDGDFNATNLGQFGGDVTTAIPIQNADGSITYATIDPQTGTLTPIDPIILQQHLQSLHLQQQQQQQQQLHTQTSSTSSRDVGHHQEGTAAEDLMQQGSANGIDSDIGGSHQQQSQSQGSQNSQMAQSRVMVPDFSPPYTFTLEPQQKHMESAYGVGAYKWWVRMRNTELAIANAGQFWKDDPLQLTTEELVMSLAMFVKEIKKPNDENYTSDSIYYFCLGIQSNLFDNGRSENVFTDTLYGNFTDSLNEVLLRFEPQITTEGMLLSRIDEECLWESMQLGAHSPHVLLNTLLYFNTKYFHLTTLEAHLSLSFKHVQKVTKTLEDGKIATVLKFYPPGDKSVEEQIQEGTPVYEQAENIDNPLRCPVRLYEFYLSKCPESTRHREDVFYLLPESLCLPDSPLWYSEDALSPTILAKMFNRIFIVKETLESNIAL